MPEKLPTTAQHKIVAAHSEPENTGSLPYWMNGYFQIHVLGASENTQKAKRQDLEKFLSFFSAATGQDQIDGWTPAVTREFQKELQKSYAATTVNRVMATLRHFSKWLVSVRPLLAGDPLQGLRDIQVDAPAWNGLNDRQLMRLKSACDHRLHACRRKDQNPLLEVVVFYVLLYTGLREFELCKLNLGDYHHRGFHQVKRKGNKITRKVPLPSEARAWLDRYLQEIRGTAGPEEALFINRAGNRVSRHDVYRIIERIGKQACAQLAEEDRFQVTPHMLRHTFLKRVADKHDVHIAQEMSGNVSMKEIFRYTKPSQEEMEKTAEGLF